MSRSIERDIFEIVESNYGNKFDLSKSICEYISNLGIEQQTNQKTAFWDFWLGWGGNHDQRIDDAKCSSCGWKHPTVYRSTDNLQKTCPSCGSKMLPRN